MSIFTGKSGYRSAEAWTGRSAEALRERGKLYYYDLGLYDLSPCVGWISGMVAATPNCDVLEVGSGFGKWAKVLEGLYRTYTGLEVVPARVQHSTELYGSDDVRFLPLNTNLGRTFDVVLSVTVIQHVTLPEAVDLLRIIEKHMSADSVALLAEWRIWDVTVEEAERLYADPANAPHMIPKPKSYLQEAVPELQWSGEPGQFILRRK